MLVKSPFYSSLLFSPPLLPRKVVCGIRSHSVLIMPASRCRQIGTQQRKRRLANHLFYENTRQLSTHLKSTLCRVSLLALFERCQCKRRIRRISRIPPSTRPIFRQFHGFQALARPVLVGAHSFRSRYGRYKYDALWSPRNAENTEDLYEMVLQPTT